MLIGVFALIIRFFTMRSILKRCYVADPSGLDTLEKRGKHYLREEYIRLRVESIRNLGEESLMESREELLNETDAWQKADLEAVEWLIKDRGYLEYENSI